MKNIKHLFLLLAFSMLVFQNAFAQISKQEAIDFVIDSIVGSAIDTVNIYMESNPLSEPYYMLGISDSISSPYNNYWLFFIDEYPYILAWEHDCYYVLIDTISGDYSLVSHNFPPFEYQFYLGAVSTAYQFPIPSIDTIQTMSYNSNDNEHLFAVLFGVGVNWHAFSHLYSALREKGFPRDNIFVLHNNGDTSHPFIISDDLDNDGVFPDIRPELCNKNNLQNIFIQLQTLMNEDDLLFMYSNSHGVAYDTNGTLLKIWEYDTVYDYDLAAMVQPLEFSQLFYVVHSCNAGGMIDNFNLPHQSVMCVVDWGRWYIGNEHVDTVTGMQPFDYGFITALRGFHPKEKARPFERGFPIGQMPDTLFKTIFTEHSNDTNPDINLNGNNDGTFQFHEIINYGKYLDWEFDTSGVDICRSGFIEDVLSPTGISGNVETTQTIEGSFLIGDNLNLEAGTTLTVDNETKLYLVNGNISTEGGSTLILKDDVLVHNFSEEAGFSIHGALQGDTLIGSDVEYVTFSSAPATSLFMGVLTDVTFSACVFDHIALSGSGYTLVGGNDLIINQSSAFSHSLILGPGHYIIDNCTFSYSSIDFHPSPAMGWNCSAFIKNSSFYLPHPDKNNIISLSSVQEFNIEGDTFSNYADQYNGGSSLLLEYCGNSGTSSWKQIKDNIFTTIEGQTYSNTNGISLYSSNAYIRNNNIQYQQNGLSLYGNCQTNVIGSHWASSENGTQQIKNNSNLQVYASEYAFPNNFIYNVVYEDTYSQTYILHDLVPGHYPVENVNCNNWGQDTYPADNLLPLDHYECVIIWNFDGVCDPNPQPAATLYQTGVDQVADSNYNAAQSTFAEVVTDYPDTEPANNAMKELLLIEALVDSTDYSGRQDWFLTEPAILGNNRLKKIGENLANKCDEKLENYPDAIDWYEDIIDDPPSLQDSVFAIIDLENVYLEMGIDTNLRSAYMGRMPQYKPVSINAHQKHRDELLALLGNVNKNNTDDSFPVTEENSKPVELLKNTPNPFTGTTQISYNLTIESDVQLIVYTYTGQLVKTINEGTKTKGIHIIDFDASGLKSGIYFYSMNINGQTIDSKKMVIMN